MEDVKNYIFEKYSGLIELVKYSETTLFYNPDKILKHGVYFCTFKEKDGPNDKLSNLDRSDVFRMSFNPGSDAYIDLFGNKPKRPLKGETQNLDYDFKKLNMLTPHPVYAWMGWVQVLNPTVDLLESIQSKIDIAYNNAVEKYNNKIN
jgi:hypothetical protein